MRDHGRARLAVGLALVLTLSCAASEEDERPASAPADLRAQMDGATESVGNLTTLCLQLEGFDVGADPAEMTPAEGLAYETALHGATAASPWDLPAEEAEQLLERIAVDDFDARFGCAAQAEFAVQMQIAGIEPLDDAVLLEDLLVNDPVIIELLDEWSSCMRLEGFDVAGPEDIDGLLASAGQSAPSEFEGAVRSAEAACRATIQGRLDERTAEVIASRS